MTDKHTQGGWHIGKAGYDKAIYDDKGGHIATIPDMLPDDEQLANARLIAAAPDMLEACKAAAEFIEGIEFNDTLTEAEEELLSQLKAAIKAARGV